MESGVIKGQSGNQTPSQQTRLETAQVRKVLPKNDTEAGLTPKQREVIRKLEGEYNKKPIEYGAIIRPDGSIAAERVGRKSNVDFDDVPDEDLKDSVLIHNHPGNGQREAFGETFAVRVGSPLSPGDLVFGAYKDVAEIRSVARDNGYIYSVKRPKDGWKATPSQLVALKNATREEGKYIFRTLARRYPEDDKVRRSRAELMAQWKSIQQMAKALGTTITRRKYE